MSGPPLLRGVVEAQRIVDETPIGVERMALTVEMKTNSSAGRAAI